MSIRTIPPSPRRSAADRGTGSYRQLGRLTAVLQLIFASWVVFAGVGIAFRVIERLLLNRAARNVFSVSRADVLASDHRIDTFTAVQIAALVVTAVVFIIWFHRAYQQVRALGGEMRYSDGWAIGSWFIPIANLWIPKKLANDIWWGSRPPEERVWPAYPALLTAWWLAWILAGVTVRAYATGDVNSVDDGLRTNLAALVSLVLLMLAAAFAFVAVRQVGERIAAGQAARGAALPVTANETTPPPSADNVRGTPGSKSSKHRRSPWQPISACVAVVAIAVGTVAALTEASGSHDHTGSATVRTAPRVVPGVAPANFVRYDSYGDHFAISIPGSWTRVDLSGPDVEATLSEVRNANPTIADYLQQQQQASSLPSLFAIDTSSEASLEVPAQLMVERLPKTGMSLSSAADLLQEVVGRQELVGVVTRKRVELPAGPAQILSFQTRIPAQLGGSDVMSKVLYLLATDRSFYLIALGGAPKDAHADTPVFAAIIRSFEISG